jgi:molybdopterin synthase sulfur carrier subunit
MGSWYSRLTLPAGVTGKITVCERVGCAVAIVSDKFQAMGAAPTITIHVPGMLRTYCSGKTELSISAGTVRAALEDLERSQYALYRNVCDETGALRQHLNVFVNSDNVRDLNGVDTTLAAGDVVTILPAVSGG